MRELEQLEQIAVVVGGGLACLVVAVALGMAGRRAARRVSDSVEHVLLDRLIGPGRALLTVIGASLTQAVRPVRGAAGFGVAHGLYVAGIAAGAWVAYRAIAALEDIVVDRLPSEGRDAIATRSSKTQVIVFRRMAGVAIVLLALALILFSFPGVRVAGASLLASAGILGVVVGIAARPVTENLLAGIQIALAQPVRVDDIVVVNGIWGQVEEIRLTHVVLRLWDRRCLVLPISTFVGSSFENWTRTGMRRVEVVDLLVDPRLPLEPVRAELFRLLPTLPDWDGRVGRLDITWVGQGGAQLHATVSAPDPWAGWRLQVAVREALLDFLARDYPDMLPRLSSGSSGSGSPTTTPGSPSTSAGTTLSAGAPKAPSGSAG